jgi:hypothetical protein
MDVLEVIDNANRTSASSLELPYDEGREAELEADIRLLLINRIENKAKLSRHFFEMNELLARAGRGGKFTAFIDGLPLGSPSRSTIYRWIEEEKNRITWHDSSDPGVEDVEDDEVNEEVEATEGESEGADKPGDSKPDQNALPHAKNFTLRLPADIHKVFTAKVKALLELRGEDANRATLFLELITAAYEAEFTAVGA